MDKHIAILPGDGIGPEVTGQALKVLRAVEQIYGHSFSCTYADVGAIAIERHGDPLPDATLQACMEADAVLFGAIGHPRFDNDPSARVRPEQGLLRLRKSLGLFANIRPVTVYPSLAHLSPLKTEKLSGVDFVIFRELTGGIYFGDRKRTDTEAYDVCAYSAGEIERIARQALDYARNRRGKLTLVDKANVLDTSRLWRAVVTGLAATEFPDVRFEWMYVDNAAMQIIQWPADFDVILTENMFGDILSDEASVLPGSLGLLPSASTGERTALFEPIHGSYPQAAGQDIANPVAAILSAAMLLDHFGMTAEAGNVRNAIQQVLEAGTGTPDLKAVQTVGCAAFGDMVVGRLRVSQQPAVGSLPPH